MKRNKITKNFEIESAERIIEAQKLVYEKELPRNVNVLKDIIKSDRKSFENYRFDGYNRDVLACLSDAYDKYQFIDNLPKTKKIKKHCPL